MQFVIVSIVIGCWRCYNASPNKLDNGRSYLEI